MSSFDALIIGMGQAGPSLAGRLSAAGMKVAVVERDKVRRHLRKRRLHAHQGHGGECLRGSHGEALGRLRGDRGRHAVIDAVYTRMPYPDFQRHVRIHPTVSELLPTVLEGLSPLE